VDERTEEAFVSPVKKVLESGKVVNLSNHALLIGKNGSRKCIEDSAAPIMFNEKIIGVVLVFRDVTNKKKTEKEILKIEKLQTVGQLAGGIAHDFNNILTGVYGNISLAKLFLDKPEKLKELLEKAETSLEKAKSLTKQLLTFSKGGAPIKELTSIESCIKESVDFVLSGSNIKVHYDFEENLQNVEIDQGQISQVFQNLALNAKEAMPTGGDIFVSIKNFRSDNSDKFLLSGNYIEITFKDTGIGIDREILPYIFEPFFTTKESGSGLGLATCFSIIQNHDGFITVDSAKGMGTVFKIYLPATDKKIEKKQINDFLDEKITDKEIYVLLMDDNEEICELAKDILSMMNCKTDIVYDGKEAVERYSNALKKGKKYDIVILDLTVPGGMGGKEAVKQLIDIDPNVKAVVSSGYSNDPVIQNYKEFGFEYVLVKPYTISQVEKMIKSLI
jgi:signal transduction histidine kinase/ActR/RegA family two-component response regulator